MTSAISGSAPVSRCPSLGAAAWLCLLTFLLALSAHFICVAEDLRPSDDNLWMYYAGSNLTHWSEGQRLNSELVQLLRSSGASEFIVKRAVLRTGYAPNMAFSAYSLQFADAASQTIRGHGGPFDQRIGDAILFGYVGIFFIAALCAVACIALLRQPAIAAAALLSVASVMFFSALTSPGFFILLQVNELGLNLLNLWQFLRNPGPQFSPFGFTPRNTVYMLSFAVLALRTAGFHGAAYWCLVPLAFVHQSVAALLFAILVALDVLLRPGVFRRRSVALAVAAFVGLLALRENLWEVIGLDSVLPPLALAAAAGLLIWFRRRQLAELSRKVRSLVERVGEMEADALLLVLGLSLTYPLFFVVVPTLDPFTVFHFWGQLHARVWAQVQPWLLFIAWWAVLRRYRQGAPRQWTLAVTLLAIGLSSPKLLEARRHDFSMTQFREGLQRLERERPLPFISVKEAESREDRFFYEMARTLETRQESLRSLFDRLVPAGKASIR